MLLVELRQDDIGGLGCRNDFFQCLCSDGKMGRTRRQGFVHDLLHPPVMGWASIHRPVPVKSIISASIGSWLSVACRTFGKVRSASRWARQTLTMWPNRINPTWLCQT